MKQKNRVLKAQEEYIKTGMEKDLLEVYNGLVGIGLTIQLRTQRMTGEWQDPDAVLDIVGNVCLRLMEKREPIVKSAPSAYMKTALFYQNNRTFHETLDDCEDVEFEDDSEESYDDYLCKVINGVALPSDSEEGELVRATLEAQIDWHIVYRHLEDNNLRKDFRKKMNEVKQYAKDNLQSNKLLSVGDSTKQVLPRASES